MPETLLPLQATFAELERDHDRAADALAAIRSLTGGYEPPEGACPTFRGLYHGLGELEHRMHLHVHLDNDILFPKALRLGRTDETTGPTVA